MLYTSAIQTACHISALSVVDMYKQMSGWKYIYLWPRYHLQVFNIASNQYCVCFLVDFTANSPTSMDVDKKNIQERSNS